MAEKTEKTKQNPVKHIPKDAQVIMSIMKDMEISEYEPRVINLLLEFTYKYVTCVLEDAKTYANHAKKKSIDLDDVKLALQIQLEQSFTSLPPRDLMLQMARSKNTIPLPFIKPHCGIRLPQDRYCLSSSNVKIKLRQYPKKAVRVTGQLLGNFSDRNMKMSSKVNIGVVKRTNNLPVMSRTQTVSITKPVPKFTNVPSKTIPKPKIHITQNTGANVNIGLNAAESSSITQEDANISTNHLKRKRDNDDYDINL